MYKWKMSWLKKKRILSSVTASKLFFFFFFLRLLLPYERHLRKLKSMKNKKHGIHGEDERSDKQDTLVCKKEVRSWEVKYFSKSNIYSPLFKTSFSSFFFFQKLN